MNNNNDSFVLTADTKIPVYLPIHSDITVKEILPHSETITKETLQEYYKKLFGDIDINIELDEDSKGWTVSFTYPLKKPLGYISFDVLGEEE